MKLRFILKSFESSTLRKVSTEISNLCLELNCKVAGVVALPIRIKKYCVLRSPHIDKDSREAFELRVHKHFIDITTEDPSVLDNLLKIEVPSGVLCSIQVLN
jgi:small subunit ribosomal protein S10